MYRLDVKEMPVWYMAPLGRQKRVKNMLEPRMTRKAKEWCDGMFGAGKVRLDVQAQAVGCSVPAEVIMLFPSEIDAMHFKLRWHGAYALI